ncbi:Acyl-CoA dehydrogenase [Planctomycetes bacterium Poly30]|uniref:Medium-chain specific acyl-CoA dehydrogenase, mitochondrial n=1 Tax=Saltatorellus ferox TaxID=2528018 RepID=A0A518EQ03_9BACT|nr:Acyl-CoA dehydrogenase [Planctomycetes bacterium Poly30]
MGAIDSTGLDLTALEREAAAFAAQFEADFDRFEGTASVEAEIEAFRHAHGRVREGGWFSHVVPEDFGGSAVSGRALGDSALGGSASGGSASGGGALGEGATSDTVCVRALCAIRQAFAFRHAMLDLAFVEQGLGSFPIALGSRFGGALDAELTDVLARTARGELIPALGLTEAGAGSDLAGVATRAERQSDGDYLISGAKTYITNVGVADYYTVLARTSGAAGERAGLTMFYVPHASEGLGTRSFRVMAPHPIGEVLFDSVRVPARHVLGEVGAGMDLALGNLARFRITVAAAANGFARRALTESVSHLSRREQFGRPLSTFQGLRFDLAEMDVKLRAAELLTAEAAARVDSGADATAEVARAKLFSTESASWICDRAVQHHGGLGVRVGSVVERLFRDTRALRIYEGTSEVQKLVLAKHVLKTTPIEPAKPEQVPGEGHND